MKVDQLRKEYIDFFKEKNHIVFPSDTLVCDDPSLLFTSAGMNQFKPYFVGQKKDIKQAVSCQRCLRTGDIEKVGKTAYHHTFFEMLGNFSFGGYFKKEAIEFAWEFLTLRLKINPQSLWFSVYKDDKEAFNIWKDKIGIPAEKIFKFGQSHNFWPANVLKEGPCGPCGPCAEIFFDKGKDSGCKKASCNPACDCGRFVEIWNLVFTQFDRQADGTLKPLPLKNIDTGMGLERIASVLQQKETNFEIDILYPAVMKVKKILGLDEKKKESLVNSIVDHSRAVIFAIADGVYPSNEERGYVVRKLLRKSLWAADLLNYKKPFIYKLIPLFAQLMSQPYPFLEEKEAVIKKVIKTEEEKFLTTLEEGKTKLNDYLKELKEKGKNRLDADKLFCLYDTYGFPFELTEVIAEKNTFSADMCGAENLLAKQKERSRAGSKFSEDIFLKNSSLLCGISETTFTGYGRPEVSAEIIKIFPCAGGKIDWLSQLDCLKAPQEGALILDKTPFYAESGGQLSDKGVIISDKGKFFVASVQKVPDNDIYIHQGKVTEGVIEKSNAKAKVDEERRKALARAHTATHLLQAALRKVLGSHVNQQGSLVDEDRLRFDFTHFEALTSAQIEEVESRVNSCILAGSKVVEKKDISLEEAKKEGALAFFKEKYKGKVRMIEVSDYSKELCGGIHLDNTAKAGGFAVVSESSVSSGIRRIEAVVGSKFYEAVKKEKNYLKSLAELLKCGPSGLKPAIEKTLINLKEDRRRIAQLESEKILSVSEELIANFLEKVSVSNLLIYDFSQKEAALCLNYSNFFSLLDALKQKLDTFFIFLIGRSDAKIRFLCASSSDLNQKGQGCKDFVAKFGKELSLKGGGTPKLVQGVVSKKDKNFDQKIKKYFLRWVEDESSKKS